MKSGNIERVGEVIKVLAKHGLGSILSRYGFTWQLPFFNRGEEELPSDLPKRLRMAIEELGGAYIKLGQLLSIRPDLVPQEYCEEFSKLLDEVPPEKLSTVEQVIIKEFNKPVKDIYSHIDAKPLGSASVAQVHKARLKTGKAVAIKVQRPDIAKKFSADIDIIRYIAQKLQKHLHNGINIPIIVDEFEQYTRKELDFTVEAGNIDNMRKASRTVVIPQVYWSQTTEKVLTMEYLEGKKLSETSKTDKPQIAKKIIDAFLDQMFNTGTFHADLHPGNVLLLKNGKIGLLDFGIVGHIDKTTTELGLKLYLAILNKDPEQISEVLLTYGRPSSKTKLEDFTTQVQDLYRKWWENNPEQRRVTHLMHQLFTLCYKNHIQLPKDIVLLGKGMMTAESTARKLDPRFNFVDYSRPKIAQLLKKQKSPKKIIEKFAQSSKQFAQAIAELPGRTIDALEAVKRGRVEFHLDDTKFRHLGKDINLSSNRLSYSMLSAALILSGAMLTEVGPKVGTYSMISIACLTAASVFIISLFISISREGNPKYDNHER